MATAQQETKEEGSEFNMPFQPVSGQLDANKIYKWSEACSIRDTFIRMIITHSGDPKSWFSAYRIQKKTWANANIGVLDREKLLSMHFETYEQVILFMEQVFKAMGYEIERRDTFDMIRTVSPEYLLADADYMTSLLASEYEWETSLKHFKSNGREFGPARYKIMDDAMFTPQTARQRPTVTQEAVDAFQGGDTIMHTVEASVKKPPAIPRAAEVQKTLDFDSVSSTDTTPNTKPKPKKPLNYNENVAQGLLKLATDGDLSVDDAMRALQKLKGLNGDTTDDGTLEMKVDPSAPMSGVDTEGETESHNAGTTMKTKKSKKSNEEKTAKKVSKKTKKSSSRNATDTEGSVTDDTGRSTKKSAKKKKKVRVQVEEVSGVSSDSDSSPTDRRTPSSARLRSVSESDSPSSGSESDDWDDDDVLGDLRISEKQMKRNRAMVMQNVQLRVFDFRNRSVEEAIQWITKLLYAANLSGWSDPQRLEAFVSHISGAVRYWWKQLARDVRRSWKKTLKAFRKRFCRDALSSQRSYFKISQRQDEKPVDYLYRLNAAAGKAGIDYDTDRKELSEHLELFFDTAVEKSLPAQLRYNSFRSVEELEEKLIQHEVTLAKARKNTPPPVTAVSKPDKPRVNTVDAPTTNVQERPAPLPQHPVRVQQAQVSNRNGEKKEIPVCEKCSKKGHLTDACWSDTVCDHCSRKGHPASHCRQLLSSLVALRERVRNGEVTAEQVLEQLN